MNIALWIAQALLAAMFTLIGYSHAVPPIQEVVGAFPSLADLSPGLIRFIGVSELLGALGLILPGLTGIRTGLTALAAAGLGIIMAMATSFHLIRAEYTAVILPIIFLATAGFVVYGRWAGQGSDRR